MPSRDVASTVRAVTLYRRGALVEREAVVEVDRTDASFGIRLSGLPLTLDDASLRVEVVGPASEDAVVAREIRVTLAVPPSDPALPPPNDEVLLTARLDRATAERNVADYERLRSQLDELSIAHRTTTEESPPLPSPTGARWAALTFGLRRAAALDERIATARQRLFEATERLNVLEERRRIASDHRNARPDEVRKTAFVVLEWPRPSRGTDARIVLRLQYFVPGARWAPAYVIRLDGDMRRGVLELRALVGQQTGENWRGVILTLSTADPQSWSDLPELKAKKIGRTQSEPKRVGWRDAPGGLEALFHDYDRAFGKPISPNRALPRPRPPSPSLPPPPSSAAAPQAFAAPPQMLELARQGPPWSGPGALAAVAVVAPTSPPAPAARRRSTSGGGHPSPPPAAAPIQQAPAEPTPPPPPEPTAARKMLDYGRLRLPESDSEGRGALRRLDPQALYRHNASAFGSDRWIAGDRGAFARLDQAESEARSFEHMAIPVGHLWPTSDEGFDYAYDADAPIDVESDGQYHALAIRRDAVESRPRFIAVPRASQDVFRTVAVQNPLPAPLLPGPIDVYVDGAFWLTSDLALTPTGGRIELGLGVEQGIRIARNVEFREEAAGMLRRQQALVHAIAIEVRNNLRQSATVEVRERVPVLATQHADEATVTETTIDPAWVEYEPKHEKLEGGRRWIVEIAPGDRRTLKATWVVTIPGHLEVGGGNRRES